MSSYQRGEVAEAFARYWQIGCVDEDWTSWTNLFTPDVNYTDHFWGPLHGRAEVQLWIDAVMAGVPDVYTVLDWYAIDDDVVTFHCQNRRDNPDPDFAEHGEPAFWDFPGLSVVWYAGDGQWAREEDFWDLNGARRTSGSYATACARIGSTDPIERMTRKHWPASGPAWARSDAPPRPSWLDRPDIVPLTRPSQLAAQLATLRGK